MKRIGFYWLNLAVLKLSQTVVQHLMGKIQCVDARALPQGAQRDRHVACTGAQIEDACIFPLEDVPERSCSPAPPQTIYIDRKRVIEKVITWSDLIEHPLHGAGGRLLVRSSGWRSP
jgi:hypothetical protein